MRQSLFKEHMQIIVQKLYLLTSPQFFRQRAFQTEIPSAIKILDDSSMIQQLVLSCKQFVRKSVIHYQEIHVIYDCRITCKFNITKCNFRQNLLTLSIIQFEQCSSITFKPEVYIGQIWTLQLTILDFVQLNISSLFISDQALKPSTNQQRLEIQSCILDFLQE